MQIFGFSIAGGSTEIIDRISDYLPKYIQFTSIEYSGHGKRIREPLYQSIEEMTSDLFTHLRPYIIEQKPYALFGYSMGCIALLQVLNRIVGNQNISQPTHIFVASHSLKSNSWNDDEIIPIIESDQDLKHRILQYGGIPNDIKDNTFFWSRYLPIYRSDYKLIESYHYKQQGYKTSIPTEVLYSETDISTKNIESWNEFCKGKIRYHQFDGGHFFIKENYDIVAQLIVQCLC